MYSIVTYSQDVNKLSSLFCKKLILGMTFILTERSSRAFELLLIKMAMKARATLKFFFMVYIFYVLFLFLSGRICVLIRTLPLVFFICFGVVVSQKSYWNVK